MDKNTTLNKGVNFLKYVALMNIRFAIFSLQEHCDINITTVREYWTESLENTEGSNHDLQREK
jgi:hypothetical protein